MYYEASKKSYYRFPSTSSIHEMDSKYYFPDKPYASGEIIRQASKPDYSSKDTDAYQSVK